MLGNLSTCLTIDCYGPVCDNAGGIAEMAELAPEVRQMTQNNDPLRLMMYFVAYQYHLICLLFSHIPPSPSSPLDP